MLNRNKPHPRNGTADASSLPGAESPEFERFLSSTALRQPGPISLKDWRDLAEAWRINQALENSQGNRSAAARELGIGRRTLYAKMEKLGLPAHQWLA